MIFWISTLMLLVLGLFAAADRLVAWRPDARGFVESVRPAQGWVGLVGVVFGLWAVIYQVLHIGLIQVNVLSWVIFLAVGVLCVALGFILSFTLLGGLLSRSDATKQKAGELYDRLAPWRPSLGMTAISTAILSVVLRILV